MHVVATPSFNKDLGKLKDKKIAVKIEAVILKLQESSSLNQITGLKKLSGALNAYRIRIGDYRLCFYYENKIIRLMVFAHRGEVYKNFP
jgi:mRNA interferase RelE/StbE